MEKESEHFDIYDSPSVRPQLMGGRKKGQNLSETYPTQHLEPWCAGVQLLAILHEKKAAKTQIIYQTCNLLIRVTVRIYKAAASTLYWSKTTTPPSLLLAAGYNNKIMNMEMYVKSELATMMNEVLFWSQLEAHEQAWSRNSTSSIKPAGVKAQKKPDE